MFSARCVISSNGTFLIKETRHHSSCWRQEIGLQNIMRMGSLCNSSHAHYNLPHENRFLLWNFQCLLSSLSQAWGIQILMPNKIWHSILYDHYFILWTRNILGSVRISHRLQSYHTGYRGGLGYQPSDQQVGLKNPCHFASWSMLLSC